MICANKKETTTKRFETKRVILKITWKTWNKQERHIEKQIFCGNKKYVNIGASFLKI